MMQSANASGEPRSASFMRSSSSIAVRFLRDALGHSPEQFLVLVVQAFEFAAEDEGVACLLLLEQRRDGNPKMRGDLLQEVERGVSALLGLQFPDMGLRRSYGVCQLLKRLALSGAQLAQFRSEAH